jgi:hypothetical protein
VDSTRAALACVARVTVPLLWREDPGVVRTVVPGPPRRATMTMGPSVALTFTCAESNVGRAARRVTVQAIFFTSSYLKVTEPASAGAVPFFVLSRPASIKNKLPPHCTPPRRSALVSTSRSLARVIPTYSRRLPS